MPLYSPGNNTIDMLLQKLASYNRKVTALPSATSNINGIVTYNGINYQSNGTNWLSTNEYAVPFQGRTAQVTLAATGGTVDKAIFPDSASIQVTRVQMMGQVITTHSAANYWTLDLYRLSITGAGSTLIQADVARTWDTGRTVGNWYPTKPNGTPASVLAVGSTQSFAYIMTKVGAPGNLTLEIGGQVYYRLVGA